MLRIRLSRIGKKNKPMYRLAVAENTRDPYGSVLEILGSYNPHTKELQAKGDRINHWISMGAQASATVNNLLVENKIIKGEKKVASKPGKKPAAPVEVKKPAAPAAAAPVEAKTEEAPSTQPEVAA